MLNISADTIKKGVDQDAHEALRYVNSLDSGNVFKRIMTVFFISSFIFMFLPWTQNIRSEGKVTTIQLNQRPQTINSIIDGRIEKWHVKEGDFVTKGDTILFISEIKDDYFDPELLNRTENQLTAKEFSVKSYKEKVKAIESQVGSLKETALLKLEQTQNKLKQANLKVKSDSIAFEASKTNYEVTNEQYKRMQSLQKDGLKSLTDLENRKNKMREAESKLISSENKLLTSKNELINAKVELSSIRAQYNKDISKAESEKYTAMSNQYDAEGSVNKLKNQFSNYSIRRGMYFITAPQNGYITKAIHFGIGETIKAGEAVVSVMPEQYDLAVALYVEPIDLPLVDIGQEVRIQFDGWPAIVFSGWPNTSYGTFGGTVFAIDKFISDNGKFRVLVKPDETDYKWPEALRVGGGTNTMMLLNEVSIWYELWRQINGFPPDFYERAAESNSTKK